MKGMKRPKTAATPAVNGRGKFSALTVLLAMLLVVVLVSACGNKGASGEGNGTAEANTNARQTAAAAETAQPSSGEGQPVLIKHSFGETEVPAHPQRVAVFGLEDLMLSLDAPMVYAYDFKGYYLDDQIRKLNIPVSDSADFKPNLEAILKTDPDLIIVQQNSIDQKGYDELSKIAPTIAFAPSDWKSSILEIGKALGIEDKAQAVIKSHEAMLNQAKEKIIQAVGPDKTVAFIRPSDKDLQLFFPSFNLVYTDFGLKPDASVEAFEKTAEDDWGVNLSLEDLPSLKADYIFAIYGGSIDTEENLQKELQMSKQIEKLQLWQSIPAVKNNQVFKVSARHWMSSGPIAESREAEDVVNAVTGRN